jgi:hypothetical protein
LNDHEPVVVPLESYAEFHEDEGEDLSVQECSLVHSSDDDKSTRDFILAYPNNGSRTT